MFKPKKILVADDFSTYSEKALETAVSIAEMYTAKVYLLHVVDHMVQQCSADYCLPNEVVERYKTESIKSSLDNLWEKAAKIAEPKHIEVESLVKIGTPYSVILEVQEEKGVDLVVIGSQGKTGLSEYLLGSVAEKVIRHSKGPVLVVRP